MKLKTISVFFIIWISAFVLKAQILNLDSIKTIIEKQNPMLSMYDMQIKASDAYAVGAKSWEPPQIGTGLYMTPYTFEKNMGSYMISIQQMIPNPAKLKASQKYMQSMSAVDIQNKNVQKNNLFSLAKMDYFEWVILKKKRIVLSESEELLQYMINVSEIRYPLEQEKLGNIYKAKAGLGELQSMQLMVDNEIMQKQISLNTLMNRDKNTSFDIDTSIVIVNYEESNMDTSAISHYRSDIKAIDQEINVSVLKQKVERSKSKPDFGIRYDNMFAFGNQPFQFSIMGMITIPIAPWSSKMYKANIEGVKYEILSFKKQKESMINEVSGMLRSFSSQIKSKKQQVSLYKNNIIPALEKNYKTSMLAYEQNTEDLFTVLDAWQTLKMAKIEHLNQLKELLLLQVKYEELIEK